MSENKIIQPEGNPHNPNNEIDKKIDPVVIYWEEFALIMQEYFQALDRYRQDPNNPVKNQIF